MYDGNDNDDALPPDQTPPADPPDTDDAEIVVTLVRQEKPFKVNGPDGAVTYKLVELTGAERDKWVTEMAKRTKVDKDGHSTGISSADGIQASLLSMAIVTDTNQKLAPLALQRWPATALNTLFMRALKMNGLDKESMDAAKKV